MDNLRNRLKKFFFCICMKMNTFALFTAKAWKKNDVKVIEYGSEIWINQKHLQKNLILQILLTELSIILQNLKKWDMKYNSVVNINLVEFLLKIL